MLDFKSQTHHSPDNPPESPALPKVSPGRWASGNATLSRSFAIPRVGDATDTASPCRWNRLQYGT